MLVTGVGLWAEDALARPQWVSGTWSVSDGLIRRVGDELADRADRCGRHVARPKRYMRDLRWTSRINASCPAS